MVVLWGEVAAAACTAASDPRHSLLGALLRSATARRCSSAQLLQALLARGSKQNLLTVSLDAARCRTRSVPTLFDRAKCSSFGFNDSVPGCLAAAAARGAGSADLRGRVVQHVSTLSLSRARTDSASSNGLSLGNRVTLYLSVSLSVSLSVCLAACQSVCLSVCLSVCPSVRTAGCLPVLLAVCQYCWLSARPVCTSP